MTLNADALLDDVLDADYVGDGEFRRHFGDSTCWGAIALLDRYGEGEASSRDLRVLDDVLARERRLVGIARPRPGARIGPRSPIEAEEAALGLLALAVAREHAHPLRGPRGFVGAFVRAGDAFAIAQGGLVERPAASFSPAALTAAVAYGLARTGGARRARVVAERVRERARPDDALARLIAAAAVARAGDADAAQHALADAARDCRGEDGLWREKASHGDRRFLSVQCFAAFAHVEALDVDAARTLLDGTWRAAWDGRRLLHDWEGDARADWYCSGCNLQAAWLGRVVKRRA